MVNVLKLNSIKGTKKRGLITSSTFYQASANTLYPKRVKAHAIRREPFTSVLDRILKFCRFR